METKIILKNFSLLFVFCILMMFIESASGYKNNDTSHVKYNIVSHQNQTSDKIKIKIKDITFMATLYDNAAAAAFKSLLPISVNMSELNDNEKYVDLTRNLPTKSYKPATIQTGDLMIYGSSTLVLFYKTFPTSYNYTKLGRIDDVKRLASAVGSGNVTITFELNEQK